MGRNHNVRLGRVPADGAAAAPPLWRRIEDAIRGAIIEGRHPPGSQLPPDRQIAAEHGASRVTARRALAALEQDGLLRIEHGNGTFVSEDALVRYRLDGSRVRFDGSLEALGDVGQLHRRLLDVWETPANRDMAARLGLKPGAPVLAMQLAAYADERPISVGVRHCDGERFRSLAEAFDHEGSLTRALRGYGVADYRRASTEVTARMPTASEARLLSQPRVSPVLAYTALDVDCVSGLVISFQVGCFAAGRVAIFVGDGRS